MDVLKQYLEVKILFQQRKYQEAIDLGKKVHRMITEGKLRLTSQQHQTLVSIIGRSTLQLD